MSAKAWSEPELNSWVKFQPRKFEKSSVTCGGKHFEIFFRIDQCGSDLFLARDEFPGRSIFSRISRRRRKGALLGVLEWFNSEFGPSGQFGLPFWPSV